MRGYDFREAQAFLERGGWQPRVCGTWDETRQYSPLDIVAKDGGLFLCKHSDAGPCPGPGWQIMSVRGSRGERGLIGPRGERGEPGPQGEPGPGITGWRIDTGRFLAIPILKGGHLGAPLQLRELFAEYDRQIHGGAPASKAVEVEAPHRDRPEAAPIVRIVSAPPPQPPMEGEIE